MFNHPNAFDFGSSDHIPTISSRIIIRPDIEPALKPLVPATSIDPDPIVVATWVARGGLGSVPR
jgi:hypothetical protein